MALQTRFRWLYALLVVVILGGATFYFRWTDYRSASQTGFAMGTLVGITAYGRNADGALNQGFERIRELERLMSTSISDSDVARLNASPVGTPVRVHEDTAYVASTAVEYAKATRGRFDPTVGRLVNLWGIGRGSEVVPTPAEIADALEGVGYGNLLIDLERLEMTRLADFHIDLGAVVKGYASDEVVKALEEAGVASGIVDLGGNIRVFGNKPGGQYWRIGIQDPSGPRGSYLGTVDIAAGAVVTSGDYERYFIHDGTRYHHILDPATGYPASPDLRSVTIIAPTGIQADALSTGLFVMGADEIFDFIASITDVGVIVVTSDGRVIVSSWVADRFNAVSEDYTYETR
jgi:thiamine biosynthesis lipoprotein